VSDVGAPRIPILDARNWRPAGSAPGGLLAMYSSLAGGITVDPACMTVPVDDHLVHRGDGVFESLKCVDRAIYNLDAHLDRLAQSAGAIGLSVPFERPALRDILRAVARAARADSCALRVLVSRGIGTMSVDPDACRGPQLYAVAYPLAGPPDDWIERGVRVGVSAIPAKPPFLARIKSCNYLPNALMKAESNRRGLEFVLSLDSSGHLAEGPTESFLLVTPDGDLASPPPDAILPGTTVERALDLARGLVVDGRLTGIVRRPLAPDDARRALELLIIGTTRDVLPAVEFEGEPVGDGRPGPVGRALREQLEREVREDTRFRTPVE
jgi:4-amino-4-deoxychorismate lyase